MTELYIIGTMHTYQKGINVSKQEIGAFQSFLKDICIKNSITAIVEEMSLEALRRCGKEKSTCKIVAENLKLYHQYCDPDSKTRNQLDICETGMIKMDGKMKDHSEEQIDKDIRKHHAKREAIWLNCIKRLNKYPTLLVCGADHVKYFEELAIDEGLNCNIVDKDYILTEETRGSDIETTTKTKGSDLESRK